MFHSYIFKGFEGTLRIPLPGKNINSSFGGTEQNIVLINSKQLLT